MSASLIRNLTNRLQPLWDSWDVFPKSDETRSFRVFLYEHVSVHVRDPIQRSERNLDA